MNKAKKLFLLSAALAICLVALIAMTLNTTANIDKATLTTPAIAAESGTSNLDSNDETATLNNGFVVFTTANTANIQQVVTAESVNVQSAIYTALTFADRAEIDWNANNTGGRQDNATNEIAANFAAALVESTFNIEPTATPIRV